MCVTRVFRVLFLCALRGWTKRPNALTGHVSFIGLSQDLRLIIPAPPVFDFLAALYGGCCTALLLPSEVSPSRNTSSLAAGALAALISGNLLWNKNFNFPYENIIHCEVLTSVEVLSSSLWVNEVALRQFSSITSIMKPIQP